MIILETSKEYEDIKFAISQVDNKVQLKELSDGICLKTEVCAYSTLDEVLKILLEKYEPSKKLKDIKRIRNSNEQQPIKVSISSLLSLYKYFKDLLISSNLKNIKYIESLIQSVNSEHLFFYLMYLQVGKITDISTVEGSDKLYIETVETKEKLQIVSGLREYYSKEQLIGKKFVFITNIKAGKIKGLESLGMILCVKNGSNVEAIQIDESVLEGERLVLEIPNIVSSYKEGKIDLKKDFYSKIFANLSVKNNYLEYDGMKIKVADNFVKTKISNGTVG